MSKTLTNEDLCRAAKRIVASTPEVQTFLSVETKGRGFDDQDRPIILFERHWFHKLTAGIYDKDHPDISNPRPGGYGQGGSQHERFSKAFALDPQAAMKSASWGIGQVMGFNYAICGYPTVDAFVDAMKESEGKQLDAAIEFICHNNLDGELRRHDWKGFARGYNGANYTINSYDVKLARAYAKFRNQIIDCSKAEAEPTDDPANVIPDATANEGGQQQQSSSVVDPAQPSSLSPQTVAPAQASIKEQIAAAFAFVTGLGINAGELVQNKLKEMTLPQIGYLVAALGLCFLGVWWYRKAHKAATKTTMTLIATAADPASHTVELKK